MPTVTDIYKKKQTKSLEPTNRRDGVDGVNPLVTHQARLTRGVAWSRTRGQVDPSGDLVHNLESIQAALMRDTRL